jgi:hypothetical protein
LIFGSPTTPIISLINQTERKETERWDTGKRKEKKRKSKIQIERGCDFNSIDI